MKYVVDIDSLINCIHCLQQTNVNGKLYVQTDLVHAFLEKFPKTKVDTEYYELKLAKEEPEDDNQGSEEEV